MNTSLRFYAELNDFLSPERRAVDISCFTHRTSVKDLIERHGVPHTEVDLILVNGRSESFSYLVHEGDRISVYPVFESFDIAEVTKVRPEPLRELRFIVDGHLGKLARLLRLLGFDTLYETHWTDGELAHRSSTEARVLLTRDRGLLKRSMVERGYCVRDDAPARQLAEVVRRFDLYRLARLFSRCTNCNDVLVVVSKEDVLERLEPKTRKYYNEFRQCSGCAQVYWRGTHFEALEALFQDVLPDQAGVTG